MRLAVWSGPRNLSTAMMYAFSQRRDCAVWDEPFYAAYLKATGQYHPMRDEILNAGRQDSDDVIRACLGPIPNGKHVFYQKHMAQHMVDGFDRRWIAKCTNVFLIRHPARVIASYAAKRENPTLDDIGFRQQAELFDILSQVSGNAPIVVDSADIRKNPTKMLRKLTEAIGLEFDPRMLHWPVGGSKNDGVWASYWYGAVQKSTGFAAAEGPLPAITPELMPTYEMALPIYEKLSACRI